MKKYILALIIAMNGVSVHAVLPPLYETIKEYKALLDDPRLVDSLTSGESIIAINKQYNTFEVVTNQRRLIVKVEYDQQSQPGPAEFHLEFSEPVKK